jgi:hypothetical protein
MQRDFRQKPTVFSTMKTHGPTVNIFLAGVITELDRAFLLSHVNTKGE